MTLHLYGIPIPDDAARAADDGTVLFDDDQPISRWRTHEAAPPNRCLCSHHRLHHQDGAGECWSTACGCSRMREKAQQ